MAMTICARLVGWAGRAAVVVGAAFAALWLGASTVASAGSEPLQIGRHDLPSISVVTAPSAVPATDMRRHLVYVFDHFELDGRVAGLESDPPALTRLARRPTPPADSAIPPDRRHHDLPVTIGPTPRPSSASRSPGGAMTQP